MTTSQDIGQSELSEFDIDVTSSIYLAAPWKGLRRIAEIDPVFWSDRLQGWVITRHADIKAGYADRRLSSARMDFFLRVFPGEPELRFPNFVKYHRLSVNFLDPPAHMRIRTLMMKAFRPQAVHALKPVIDAIVDEVLEALPLGEEFNFLEHVSAKLPTRVIQSMLGVPLEMADSFRRLADDILRATDSFPPTDSLLAAADAAIVEINELFLKLIADRRDTPTHDVLSDLVQARDQGDRLDDDELLAACHAIVEAGSETTAMMLAIGVNEIARLPSLASAAASSLEGAARVVGELLRFPGLVMGMTRIVGEPFEWHGKMLAKGDIVFLMNGAGNVDPARFDRPEEIDIDRDVSESLSFGPGFHFCIGHFLARTELAAFFHATFSRYEVEITERQIEYIPSWVFHGYRRLNTRFVARLTN